MLKLFINVQKSANSQLKHNPGKSLLYVHFDLVCNFNVLLDFLLSTSTWTEVFNTKEFGIL